MGADMEIAVIGFSRRGLALGQRLLAGLREKGWQAHAFAKCKSVENEFMQSCHPIEESIGEWTGKHFSKFDALIFVGACGIAVRSIAPYVKKKTTDPAVVVVDERGVFSISLLSGHIGGGNDLAQTAAEIIGAQPVVTTATDLNQVFAVDVFAKQNGCSISDMKYAKEISAQLLEGKTIGFSRGAACGTGAERAGEESQAGDRPDCLSERASVSAHAVSDSKGDYGGNRMQEGYVCGKDYKSGVRGQSEASDTTRGSRTGGQH